MEICQLAGANVAAVNYHFRDKETLYAEAWRHAFSESIRAYPPDGDVRPDAPAEDRLRGQIDALLRRIGDDDNREFWIARQEMANPTGLLEEVMREEVGPLHQRMEGVVRELLGPRVPLFRAQYCVMSIVSQCADPIAVRRCHMTRRGQGKEVWPYVRDIGDFARHVTEFSLGALRAIRAAAEAGPAEAASGREWKGRDR
jgi:AcrR family transcriptional regulator